FVLLALGMDGSQDGLRLRPARGWQRAAKVHYRVGVRSRPRPGDRDGIGFRAVGVAGEQLAELSANVVKALVDGLLLRRLHIDVAAILGRLQLTLPFVDVIYS